MSYRPDTPFDSVESAHEYVHLLEEAIAEAIAGIRRFHDGHHVNFKATILSATATSA